VLTLPGASYLAGLHALGKLNYSAGIDVLVIVGFNLIMLILLEVPLVLFAVAPTWTPGAIGRGKAWVAVRWRRVAIRGFAAIGAALIIKGIVGLIV
jgi:hypothetical protein